MRETDYKSVMGTMRMSIQKANASLRQGTENANKHAWLSHGNDMCLLNNVHRFDMAMRNAVLWASTTSIMMTADEPRSTERVSSPNLPDIWDMQALTFIPVGEKRETVLEVENLKVTVKNLTYQTSTKLPSCTVPIKNNSHLIVF